MEWINQANIERAHQLILPYIHHTPTLTSSSIDKQLNCKLYFKCENLQKIGAFKMRGASHFLLNLLASTDSNDLKVVTHSSGNHAQAVALAAKMNGVKAFIVMPKDAPKVKVEGVKAYGGEIHFCEPNLAARESTMESIREKVGAIFIPPYDHADIIVGQATAAKEMLESEEGFDYILAPVGGGGLLAGTAISAKIYSPNSKVIGCEPKMADDAFQSFQKKEWVPSVNPKTIGDGLKTSLGKLNFEIILKEVDQILCCSEETMVEAMQLIWERMKIVIEPSAAVPLACIMENQELFKGKKIGIIVSGGNVDVNDFFEILSTKIQS